MSVHYSKFSLNTYAATPYFRAQLPEGYPLDLILQKSRAYRRLPQNLRKLAGLSKQWAGKNWEGYEYISEYYDAKGNELDPISGRKLTDDQIDDEWDRLPPNPALATIAVTDIPSGDFADPDTWVVPANEPTIDAPPNEARLRNEIRAYGKDRVSAAYGIPIDKLPDVEQDQPILVTEDVEEEEPAVQWDMAVAQFKEQAANVLKSKYFATHKKELTVLKKALEDSNIYMDLDEESMRIFDEAASNQ